MRRRALLLLAGLGLAWTPAARAAGHGSLRVRVVDEGGKPLSGVEVLLTLKDTWRKRRATTDAKGEVHYFGVAAEPFRVTLEAKGLDTTIDSRPCLEIVSGRTLLHTMVMRPTGARARPQERCPELLPESSTSLPLPGPLYHLR